MRDAVQVGIYARVSTEEQKEGYSLAAQERAGHTYAATQPNWHIYRVYGDEGYTGRNEHRPALQQLLADAAKGRIQVVIVHKIDRLARNARLTLEIIQNLERQNVTFVSLSEQIDFSTPIGRVLLANLAAFAQFFSENLGEETKKGMLERARQGGWIGPVPYGYRMGEHGVLVVDEHEAAVVVELFELYKTGNYSYAEIAALLNARGLTIRDWRRRGRRPFGEYSIRSIFDNRAYIGLVSCSGEEYHGQHQPIISQELWDAAQAARESRSRRGFISTGEAKSAGPLTGLVYCALCGEAMWHHISGNEQSGYRRYYICGARRGLRCASRMVRGDRIEEQVESLLQTLSIPEAYHQELAGRVEQALKRTERQSQRQPEKNREALEEELRRIAVLYKDRLISHAEYVRDRDAIWAQLAQLEEHSPAAPLNSVDHSAIQRAVAALANVSRLYQAAAVGERAALLKQLFHKLYLVRESDHELRAVTPAPAYLTIIGMTLLWVGGLGLSQG